VDGVHRANKNSQTTVDVQVFLPGSFNRLSLKSSRPDAKYHGCCKKLKEKSSGQKSYKPLLACSKANPKQGKISFQRKVVSVAVKLLTSQAK
jgi:hypothetical protein